MNYASKYISQNVNIKIDRPLGSNHPKFGWTYPINYGFVPDTNAPDGKEVDAYLLGVFDPVEKFCGKCIAVIRREEDDDDKLVVVPDGTDYSDTQIMALTEFQERFFNSTVMRHD
jgi:inorganic pyrophosphatase